MPSRKLRIFHVLNHTHRANGHVCAMLDLACAQAAQGHEVQVCSAGGDFDELLQRHGIAHVRIDQSRRPLTLVKAYLRMVMAIRRMRADVVHAHMMTSAGLAFAGKPFARFGLVTTVHNEFQKSAKLMGLGDRVIGVSRAVTASMIARGVPARKMRTVLNGTIGSARFPAAPEALELAGPSILFVGGLHPRKGVADLITAYARVLETAPEARLYLVGSGPMEALYRTQAEAEAPGRVVFCGHHDDPRSYMRGADIFVLPSHQDPAPLVLSEARESGCAIVASSVGGIPELVENGRAATLVPARRPDLLADALLALLRDPAALRAARANSQLNIERLSMERVARETLAIYRELIEPSRQTQARAAAEPVGELSGDAA